MTDAEHTTPQSVAAMTKSVLTRGVVPNMLLKNVGAENGFTSDRTDCLFWLNRICGECE